MIDSGTTKKLAATLRLGSSVEARITVVGFYMPIEIYGDRGAKQTVIMAKVEFYQGERRLGSGPYAMIDHYEDAWVDHRAWDEQGLDCRIPMTRVGNKARVVGDFKVVINTKIDTMTQTVLDEMREATPTKSLLKHIGEGPS